MAQRDSPKRLGVMGGTFDPIHMGHLVAASEVLHAFELDRMLFVPAGEPWQKDAYSEAEDRLLMTMLAASTHARFAVSRIELDRSGPTYSADTMETLRDFYGEAVELFFVVGADAGLKLGTWAKLDRLAELASVIVVARPTSDLSDLHPEAGWPRVHTLEMPGIEISSTDIRERVRRGAPIDFLVPEAVAAYIAEHGLYAGESRG